MENIYESISNSTIEVYNQEGNVVSYAFVLNFSVKNDEKTIRPFLITNKQSLLENDLLYILLDSKSNDVVKKHRINFSKDLIADFEIEGTDTLALPLAQTINDLEKSQIQISLNGLPDILIPSKETFKSLEKISEFTWFSFDETLQQKICNKQNNITLLKDNTHVYFTSHKKFDGAPVFLINFGTFFENNSFSVGTRILFMGCFISNTKNGYSKMILSDQLANGIKRKFNFE